MPDTEELTELMQLVADGEATPQEEARLRAILASSPAAAAELETLKALVSQLNNVPLVNPPGVRPAVMSQISASMWGRASARPRHRRKRLFAALYAAAAIVIVLFAVHRNVAPRTSSATMTRIEEEWPIVARASAANARLTVRGSGDEFIVDVNSKLPYSLDWDATRLDRIESTRFRRRAGATGRAVIRLRLPDNTDLNASVDLR
jgi:anti-sigma factor RsiW